MTDIPAHEIIEQKKKGTSDKEIGELYNVSYRFIEETITKELGLNISSLNAPNKKIRKLEPKDFQLETTTVWSFKSRGNWATHNGNYRGNWSPYIPRNIILKYSKENDTVLDYFCGSGTTAVECKLLHRNFIGIDINSKAIELARRNLGFEHRGLFNRNNDNNIQLFAGDARNLSCISDNSIDLICAHPPYANIINYTNNHPSDLSHYPIEKFLEEIKKVADESYRVLKDGSYCAILIGDTRKNKNVIPLGFWTIQRFIQAGFGIKELIIKRQHNCKTSGFWYKNSIKYNFLLLAHEYLVVFKKVKGNNNNNNHNAFNTVPNIKRINISSNVELETTTVWIFNEEEWLEKTVLNMIKRYSSNAYLLFSHSPEENRIAKYDLIIGFYNKQLDILLKFAINNLKRDGVLAIVAEDIRLDNNLIFPSAIKTIDILDNYKNFKIKEIVVLSIEHNGNNGNSDNLTITHKYLLIYKRVDK